MRARLTSVVMIVALCLTSGSQLVFSASGPAPGSALTTNRRILDMTANSSFFEATPSYEYGWGSELHVPGEDCNFGPAQLNLNDLTFERRDDGYLATVIFFATIVPLNELNGNPVTHSIRLILTPPDGDSVVIRQSLTTGNLTVKQGKETLDLGEDAPVAKLDGDRLFLSVPDAFGVKPDWSIQAEVDVEGKEPICPYAPEAKKRSTISPPVTVGSLSGEDQNGAITFTTIETATAQGDKRMPAGSRITSLSMEQNADGSLVVIATMDGDVLDLPKSGSEPFTSLNVVLDLASPSFFGVAYPYEVDWSFPMTGQPEPVARVYDPYFSSAIALGEVPVTIDGDKVRFDFGKFKAYPPDTTGLTQSFVPFGETGMVFFGTLPHDDPVCLCSGGPKLPEGVNVDLEDDQLAYLVLGNLIAITHVDTGETAYGWIDYEGRFRAENETEEYKGEIKLFPDGDGYEVGVHGTYSRLLDGEQLSFSEPTLKAVQLTDISSSHETLPQLFQAPANEQDLDALLVAQRVIDEYTNTEIRNCLDETKELSPPDPIFRGIPAETYDCGRLRNAIDVRDFILSKYADDPDFQQAYRHMLAQAEGMAVPGEPDSIFGQYSFAPAATPVAGGIPFPLPLSIASQYEPDPINSDWAIRAGSFYSYPVEAGGVTLSVTSPFVDSHLLLTTGASGSNGFRPAKAATIDQGDVRPIATLS